MEYWVVTKELIDDIAGKLGDDFYRSYLEREVARCDLFDQQLVLFRKEGVWKEVRISGSYNVDFVMKEKWNEL